MSAEQSLYDALRVSAAVTAVVAQRIYLDVIPQNEALPAIAFVRTGTEFLNTIHGAVLRTRATVEVWCVASTRTAAESLASVVTTELVAAGFQPSDRRPESDNEAVPPVFSAVLTLSIWE